jgi:hypothetical protein
VESGLQEESLVMNHRTGIQCSSLGRRCCDPNEAEMLVLESCALSVPKDPCIKEREALLDGGKIFKRWGLMGGVLLIGTCP